MLDAGKQLYADYYHVEPDETPPDIINNILNYVGLVDYLKVTDPQKSYAPQFKDEIKNYVEPVASFVVDEIREATMGLRAPTISVLAGKDATTRTN